MIRLYFKFIYKSDVFDLFGSKLVKHFIANPQPHQQPPHEPVAQPVILPVAPASPPQSNVVTVTSEAPEPVSPTISKAIEEFFAES